jgi:hypothetical protein
MCADLCCLGIWSTDLKLILAEREEELRQSLAKSTKFYRIAIGTTCMGGLAVVAAIVLLVRQRGMSRR